MRSIFGAMNEQHLRSVIVLPEHTFRQEIERNERSLLCALHSIQHVECMHDKIFIELLRLFFFVDERGKEEDGLITEIKFHTECPSKNGPGTAGPSARRD